MKRKNNFLRIYLFYCFSCFLYLRFQNRYQEAEGRKPPGPIPRCQVVWNADASEHSLLALAPHSILQPNRGPRPRAEGAISSLNGNGTGGWSVWKENKYSSVHWVPSWTLRYFVSKYHLGLEDGPHRIPGTRKRKRINKGRKLCWALDRWQVIGG